MPLLLALVLGGGLLYRAKLRQQPPETAMSESTPLPSVALPPASQVRTPGPSATGPTFRCDGRKYCAQMTSCAEATYFLKNCPGTRMDGDHDGVPCEQQWCADRFTK